MKSKWLVSACAVMAAAAVVALSAANPGVTLIGVGAIPGNSLDRSGLAGKTICRIDDDTACIDQATLGGLGSAVTYTGFNNVFLAVPDRGPFDGRTNVPYFDRFHLLQMTVDTKAAFPNIKTSVVATRFLKDEWNRRFVGDAYAFDTEQSARAPGASTPKPSSSVSFGTIFIADEYGPYVREFDRSGRLLRRILLPEKFRLDPVDGRPDRRRRRRRQLARALPSTTTSPDDRPTAGWKGWRSRRTAARSSASCRTRCSRTTAFDPIAASRVGFNNRLVTIDLLTGRTREYVYVMDAVNQGRGVNEILAHQRSRVPRPRARQPHHGADAAERGADAEPEANLQDRSRPARASPTCPTSRACRRRRSTT